MQISRIAGLTSIALVPTASRNASLTGQYFDTKDLAGDALVILNSSACAGGTTTLDVKLQGSSTTASNSFADIEGATFDQVTTAASLQQKMLAGNALPRYIKVIGTNGSGTTAAYGVVMVTGKKYSLDTNPTGN